MEIMESALRELGFIEMTATTLPPEREVVEDLRGAEREVTRSTETTLATSCLAPG